MNGGRQFDRTETTQLTSAVSGGYNTSDSDLLTPLTDSPNMNNMQVDFDGMARKRQGYRTLLTRNQTVAGERSKVKGSFIIPLQTASGRPILIIREDRGVVIMGLQDDGSWVQFIRLTNIWGTKLDDTAFDYIVQYEPLYTRVILVHPKQIPVQISIVATHLPTFPKGVTSNSWTIPDLSVSYASVNNSTGYSRLIINGTLVTPTGAASSPLANGAVALTTTTPAVYNAGTYDLEVLYFGWQIWAEALLLNGDQLVSSVVQGVSTKTVAVPSSLLMAISAYDIGLPPIRAYQTTNYDNLYSITGIPNAASNYVWSNGALADGVTPPPAGFGFLSFGNYPSSTRTITITRGYRLPFQGNSGMSWVDGTRHVLTDINRRFWGRYPVSPPSEGGAGVGTLRGYTLRNASDYYVNTGNVGRGQNYISLDANSTANGGLSVIGAEDKIWIIDADLATLMGSQYCGSQSNWYIPTVTTAAISIITNSSNYPPDYPSVPFPGALYPVPGISWYADYKRGSFPSCISTLQGRIVLAGFRDNPMTLIVSNPYDTDSAGLYANNFDAVYTIPSEVSPFDIILPGKDNDIITDMLEYNDSLFVFTKFRIFRIHANGGLVNVTNAKYSLIAEIGVQNSRSVVLTDEAPVFLSTSGVFALVPDDTSAGYSVQELSGKVRNFIQSNNDTIRDVGFLLYDSGRNELYVGLSDNYSRDRTGVLLVYNTRLGAWYPYTSLGGVSMQVYWGALLWDTRANAPVIEPKVLFSTFATLNDDDYMQIIEMNRTDVPVDLVEQVQFAANPISTRLVAPQATWAIIPGCQEYDPSNIQLFGEAAFRMSPIRDMEDVYVAVDGVQKVFGVDFIKTERGTLYFPTAPVGTTLLAQMFVSYEGSTYFPVTVYNATTGKLFQLNERSAIQSGGKYQVTISSGVTAGDILWIGYAYPAWYTTPTFNSNTLRAKRIKNYIGYYHNTVSKILGITDAPVLATTVGKRQAPLNVNVAVLFSNEYEGTLQMDLYENLNPSKYPNQQVKDYSRISVPIVGNGYNIQVVHHNNTPSTFKLAGYELDYVAKKGKGYSKSEENLN